MKPAYSKPAISISEQIHLLETRGLIIKDLTQAEHYLKHIGYYRLAGYWRIFQSDKVNHTFLANVQFRHIVELYEFDRELRTLLFDAIERIEISLRSLLINEMSMSHGAQWYEEEALAERTDLFTENLSKIVDDLNRSDEEFMKHHDSKYGQTYPPCWKAMQVLSLGTLSKIYANIGNHLAEKKLISEALGLPAPKWLESWLQVINVLRNLCAHHSRIAYRLFNYPPKYLHTSKYPWVKTQATGNSPTRQSIYYQLITTKFILNRCYSGNDFSSRLKLLFEKYPSIIPSELGFPVDWKEEFLWA